MSNEGGGERGDGEGYGRRVEGGDMEWWGDGDESSEYVDMTSWPRLNIHE